MTETSDTRDTSPLPCEGLHVIDLSDGPAGGVATMALADFGADVVKVERLGGDPLRRLAAWPVWLRGKRSMELDLASEAGRAALHRMVRGADVVVASYRPGRAEALGADYEMLSSLNPALVYCSVTAFGSQGPDAGLPGYEGVVAAKTGRMQHFEGLSNRPGPSYSAVQIGTHGASQSALAGILAALLTRERDGRGQLVETSLLQGMLPYDLNSLLRVQLRRRYPEQMAGDQTASYGLAPPLYYQPSMAKDGRWIQPANLVDHLFHSHIIALGLDDIYGDERFEGAPRRLDEGPREELRNRILERVRERPADEWMAIFRESGNVAAEPFYTALEGLEHPDVVASGEAVTVPHPRLGAVKQPGLLARLGETPGRIGAPAPEVGAHTDELLAEAQRDAPVVTRAASADTRPPLDGVTVLEFATVIAAPLGASLVADLGARVIKVEPIGGESLRGTAAGLGGYLSITKTTASKESICLDLKSEAGRAIVDELLAKSDVLIHNYRPGVPERLGIGYEHARELSPGIVYVPVNGYGAEGPGAHRPSAHPIPGAVIGGALHQAGSGMPPTDPGSLEELREGARWLFRANEANPDPSTSMVVASTVLLGLWARQRLGVGQVAQVTMLGANTYANIDGFVSYEGMPPRRPLDPLAHGPSALYRLYEAAEGWVFLAAPKQREWEALCSMVGPELASDAQFATAEARAANDLALCEALSERFGSRSADEWESVLVPLDVGCVRADRGLPGDYLDGDPHAEANGFTVEAEHEMWGSYRRWGPAVSFGATPGRYAGGVMAGQHTDSILRELGRSDAEIADLREHGVAWSEAALDPTEVT